MSPAFSLLESGKTLLMAYFQAAEEEAQRREQEEHDRQAALVRKERQRLLKEAAYLKDYLPKGVLHDLEELRLVNEAAGDQSIANVDSLILGASNQPLHVTGPVHGVQNIGQDGIFAEKLHYANYVPGETPLLQDSYQSSSRH